MDLNLSFHGDGDEDDFTLLDDYVLINPCSSCHATTVNESPETTIPDSACNLSQKQPGLSAETIGEIPSVASSSPSDSMQPQHQAPTAPAGVSNMSVPLNTNNSISTPPLADKFLLDRFAQIEKAAILYSMYQNYTDKLAAEFLSLMTHEGLQPQKKQTIFEQQQQQLQRHYLLQQEQISPSQVSNITTAINLQLRNGSITQDQADAMEAKLKMLHNQTSNSGEAQPGIVGMTATGKMLEGDQSGITGMAATGEMLDGVKFGIRDKTATGKSGITSLTLTATGQVLEGAGQMLRNSPSSYMKQQQQQQNIILQQRIQQQEQQEQLKYQERQLLYLRSQQLRQQQIGFPLQAVVSSPPVGSPTANQSRLSQQMSSQLKQFGQQKTLQQTSKIPQLNSGSTPQVNDVASKTMVTPASPQSSPHTSNNLVLRKLSNKSQWVLS